MQLVQPHLIGTPLSIGCGLEQMGVVIVCYLENKLVNMGTC